MKFNFERAATGITKTILSSPHPARLMKTLCRQIGPRPPGSAAMRKAQEFLRAEWAALGVESACLEKVTFDGWQPGKAVVEMLSPRRRRFDCIQAVHSAAGHVDGPLFDGGSLSFADLHRLGDHARGAVLLLRGHQISGGRFEPVQKRISLAEALGAAAVLLVGWDAKLPTIQFLNRSQIPVVNLAPLDWERLRTFCAKKNVRVRVRTAGRTRRVTCGNLAGLLGSRRGQSDLLIACAHLDGFHLSPAAMDNLSGVVTMAEVARALVPYREHFVRTLRLIAFTGEEYGYAGSKQYVRTHHSELDRTRFVLSMDCMFQSTAEGVAVMWSPEMRRYIAQSLRQSRPEVDVRNSFCMSSDYLPFMLAGIPAARPADWRNSFPRWTHTTEDTDDKVPAAWLKSNAALCATILLRMLTDGKPLPSRRNTPEEVARLVEKEGAEEALRWQVLLPA